MLVWRQVALDLWYNVVLRLRVLCLTVLYRPSHVFLEALLNQRNQMSTTSMCMCVLASFVCNLSDA